MKDKLIIIGAGISGLYAAYLLQNDYDITILEARDRVGGRIYGIGELDMGPSWVWKENEAFLKLANDFNLSIFPQYEVGFAVYQSSHEIQKFKAPTQNNSYHLEGGMSSMINTIKNELTNTNVKLQEVVNKIEEQENGLLVTTNENSYKCDYVISTLPPRLASQSIIYEPELSPSIKTKMNNIPTWMGYITKVVIEYKEKFWREEGLSGHAISHLGPLSEIHDISSQNTPTLFGFMSSKTNTNKTDIVNQMKLLFGEKASDYKNIYITNWSNEKFTAVNADKEGLKSHPNYGFDINHFKNKMFFIGTESSYTHGGYIEGAIQSAIDISKRLSK